MGDCQMNRYEQTRSAILEIFRDRQLSPDQTLILIDVRLPLAPRGFSVDDIVDALFGLKSEGILELIDGDRVTLRVAV